MSAFLLELPLPPNVANARWHWAVKDKKRAAFMLECDVRRATNPRPPETPMQHASISVTMRVPRLMDHDNAMARCKWALDWLVRRGYLKDDSPKYLTFASVPRQEVNTKNQGLTITLQEAA